MVVLRGVLGHIDGVPLCLPPRANPLDVETAHFGAFWLILRLHNGPLLGGLKGPLSQRTPSGDLEGSLCVQGTPFGGLEGPFCISRDFFWGSRRPFWRSQGPLFCRPVAAVAGPVAGGLPRPSCRPVAPRTFPSPTPKTGSQNDPKNL